MPDHPRHGPLACWNCGRARESGHTGTALCPDCGHWADSTRKDCRCLACRGRRLNDALDGDINTVLQRKID